MEMNIVQGRLLEERVGNFVLHLSWVKQKKKEKTEGRAAFFSFSVIFVSERINCVRASILLAYIWALKAKQSLLWNYLFLAPHNIVPHCEEIQHLEKAKVWLKHRAALLFKGLGWIEEKRRKQEKKKKTSKLEPFAFCLIARIGHAVPPLWMAGLVPLEFKKFIYHLSSLASSRKLWTPKLQPGVRHITLTHEVLV